MKTSRICETTGAKPPCAAAVCDRVAIIHHGRMKKDRALEDIFLELTYEDASSSRA